MSVAMRFGMSTVMHGVLADMNALEEVLQARNSTGRSCGRSISKTAHRRVS